MSTQPRIVTFEPFRGRRRTGEVVETSLEMVGDCRAEVFHTVAVDGCSTRFRVPARDVTTHE
ncbi:hypothetical protein [Halomarina rubra]|uniref:Uncharacterized protein n=1 Tax=Halomarina rubra TaxID=2071873 RepID=A0ABD6B0U9_9EURY|nr:hypothetical protein [Halomarina rubra]